MRRVIMLGVLCLAVLSISGCGSSPDALMQKEIDAMNALADALENNAPEAKVAELHKKLDDINLQLKDLNLSAEDLRQLNLRHKDAMQEAGGRLLKASLKNMGGVPGGLRPLMGRDQRPTMPQGLPEPPVPVTAPAEQK